MEFLVFVFWMLEFLKSADYKVDLLMNNWTNMDRPRGLTFNVEKKSYIKGSSSNLWDNKIHPKDIYENLVLSTFDNINLITEDKYSLKQKIRIFIPPFLSYHRFVYYDFVTRFMPLVEYKKYLKQKKKELFLNQPTLKHLIRYVLFVVYTIIFRHFKIKVKSLGFRFKLSIPMHNDLVKNFINKHKNNRITYILISVTWDEQMKFEVLSDRLRGGPFQNESEWNRLKNYVKQLDDFALKTNKIKFILASKKAVDWENYIQSEFLDLRTFEELGFTLSQTIFIIQELSDVTLNWPSAFTNWITNCKNIIHLTWHDNKDTAEWARNDLHEQPVKHLLDKLGLL